MKNTSNLQSRIFAGLPIQMKLHAPIFPLLHVTDIFLSMEIVILHAIAFI